MKNVKLRYINNSDNEEPLWKKHKNDAGWDIRSNETISLYPGETIPVRTGIHIEIPDGYYGQIADRSGLAKEGISTRGGVIDSGYRGEVMVLLHNERPRYTIDIDEETGIEIYDDRERGVMHIQKGDRIAQLIVYPVVLDAFEAVDGLDEAARGDDGFGSSGLE